MASPLSTSGGIHSMSQAHAGVDLAAFYYAQHQQGAELPRLVGAGSLPLSPPVSELLDASTLHFLDTPGLLQRALLWESGLLVVASDADANGNGYADEALAQVYTRCGAPMSGITLSERDVRAAGCRIDSCSSGGSTRVEKSSSRCPFDGTETDGPLLSAAKCAVVRSQLLDTPASAIGSGVDVRVWSDGVLDGSWLSGELRPQLSTVAASLDDTTFPDALFPVIRIGQTASAEPADIRESDPDHCRPPRSVVIPCAQLDAPPTDTEDWCYPTPSPLLRQWLLEFRGPQIRASLSSGNGDGALPIIDTVAVEHSGAFQPAALASTTGISVPDAAAQDVSASLTTLWPTSSGSDAIAMSSDLARMYYRMRSRGYGLDSQQIESVEPPQEVQDRMRSFQIGFGQLSWLLRRALLWDAGYVVAAGAQDDGHVLLVPVWVRCGLRMADLALSRAAFDVSGCGVADCSTFNATSNTTATSLRSDVSSPSCSPAKLAAVTACAVDTASLGGRNVSLARSNASIWSLGLLSSSDTHVTPRPTIQRHLLASTSTPAELYTIQTHYALDALELQAAGDHRCPRTPSLVIPCVPLELVASDQSAEWCRPAPSELVSAWLVVEERQYRSLFHLVAIGVAGILAIVIDLYFDRKPRRVRAAASVGAVAMPSVASSALDFDPDRASSNHLSAASATSGVSSRRSGDTGDW